MYSNYCSFVSRRVYKCIHTTSYSWQVTLSTRYTECGLSTQALATRFPWVVNLIKIVRPVCGESGNFNASVLRNTQKVFQRHVLFENIDQWVDSQKFRSFKVNSDWFQKIFATISNFNFRSILGQSYEVGWNIDLYLI